MSGPVGGMVATFGQWPGSETPAPGALEAVVCPSHCQDAASRRQQDNSRGDGGSGAR